MTSRPPRDVNATKARILAAARTAFSQHGYAAASLRDIARVAEASPALTIRYFGSKEELFEAALDDMLDASILTDIDRATFGARLVETFAGSNPDSHPLRVMILSCSDARARAIIDSHVRSRLMVPLTAWLGPKEAEARAAHLLLLSAGLFFYRLIYPLEPLTGAMAPASRAWLAREFQAIIDG